MARHLRIDFVSDVACPWCVVGLRSLLQALDALGADVVADIRFQPFELNPDMAPEGENAGEHIQKKYGSSPQQSASARQAIRDTGAAFGFTFNYGPESRIWNTFDAHRLLYWAGVEGRQLALKEALFKVNFTDQLPTSEHEVLIAAAQTVGLDAVRAREILASGQYASEVRHEEQVWRDRGIQAVPTIVFNERWMIQGGQAPEVFERAIRKLIASEAA